MVADAHDYPIGQVSPEALLLLNRATLVSQTVRTAVHEVNNVLQMISGLTEMIGSKPGLPPDATARLDAILRHTNRGHAILQAVAQIARGETGAGKVIDVAQTAEHVLQMRRYEHHRAGIASALDRRGPEPCRVRIDPQHLQQMLLNLVINAEQALAGVPQGEFRLTVARDGEQVEIRISDNGAGIDSGVDPFAAFTTTLGTRAAGLGLTATRMLADRYGGSLSATNGSPGAVFVLRLPSAS